MLLFLIVLLPEELLRYRRMECAFINFYVDVPIYLKKNI
jgi:hypothetical protein